MISGNITGENKRTSKESVKFLFRLNLLRNLHSLLWNPVSVWVMMFV